MVSSSRLQAAALAAFGLVGVPFGAALPAPNELVANSCFSAEMDCVPQTANVFDQLIKNATYLAAWQMTGITEEIGKQNNPDSLRNLFSTNCKNSNHSEYNQRWKDVGLNTEVLKIAFCGPTSSSCSINQATATILRHIGDYITDITTVQLLHIWQPYRTSEAESALSTICSNLQPVRVQTVLNSVDIIKNICIAASEQSTPVEPAPSPKFTVPTSDLIDMQGTASELFAWQLHGVVHKPTQVKTACTDNRDALNAAVNSTLLDPTKFGATFCNKDFFSTLPTPTRISQQITEKLTHLFTTNLWNFSDSDDYRMLICGAWDEGTPTIDNISSQGVMSVGMDYQQFFTEMQDRCRSILDEPQPPCNEPWCDRV